MLLRRTATRSGARHAGRGRPLVVHILDRLDAGGMEAVTLDLVAGTLPRYRHVVLCLRGYGSFRNRFRERGVRLLTVNKRPGKDLLAYLRLWRVLRRLRPDIVHTCNVGAIDAAFIARLAGVRRVVHAEHGRDASDPRGRNRKYRWLRRLLSPCIDVFVAVSDDLRHWLTDEVGIRRRKVRLIHNGVDTRLYRPDGRRDSPLPPGFAPPGSRVVGTVGRLDKVKAQTDLMTAFAGAWRQHEDTPAPWRLVIIGDGPEKSALEHLAVELGIAPMTWLGGEREDVAGLLRTFDVYVSSSIAEGISLTLLEAMASALPVIATQVGGNPELVVPGETGRLIPASRPQVLAQALREYLGHPEASRRQGEAGRERVREHFSLSATTTAYAALYDQLLGLDRQAASSPMRVR